jgi:hypothetical protein
MVIVALVCGAGLALAGCESSDDGSASAGDASSGDTGGAGSDAGSGDASEGSDADGEGTEEDSVFEVECPPKDAVRPNALAEMDGVWDPIGKRMVFFGGDGGFPIQCSSNPDPKGATWAYDPVCEVWTLYPTAKGPSARTRHSAVYDSQEHRMIVFGGRYRVPGTTEPYTLYDEVWAFDLTTNTWSEIATTGTGPSPRWSAAAIYVPKAHMLLVSTGNVGTSATTYSPAKDTFALNLGTGAWMKVGAEGPDARLFAAATYDAARHRMLLFGGTTAFFGPMRNDVWAYDIATAKWTNLNGGLGTAPLRRFWARMLYDGARDRVVLMGGHDDTSLGNRNDLWVFDLASNEWDEVSAGDVVNPAAPEPGFCDFPVNFVNMEPGSPERRSGHIMVDDGARAVVFGGKTDCGIVDDVWSLDLETLAWEELLEPTVGQSCERAGIEGCDSFCF